MYDDDDDIPSPVLARMAGGMLACTGVVWSIAGVIVAVLMLGDGFGCGGALASCLLASGLTLMAKGFPVAFGRADTDHVVTILSILFAVLLGSVALVLVMLSWAAAGVVAGFALPFMVAAILSLVGSRDYADWRESRNLDD